VVSYGFCSKFRRLSSNTEFKRGTFFFETQCISLMHSTPAMTKFYIVLLQSHHLPFFPINLAAEEHVVHAQIRKETDKNISEIAERLSDGPTWARMDGSLRQKLHKGQQSLVWNSFTRC